MLIQQLFIDIHFVTWSECVSVADADTPLSAKMRNGKMVLHSLNVIVVYVAFKLKGLL